jgi:pantoate--beta-alanine ligase
MGALHAGHLSLVKKSGNICRNTIVSIYLNPAQFSPDEDLDSYPNKVKNDIEQLKHYQTDCVFLPRDSDMYPRGFSSSIQVADISKVLEGKSRSHFFQGVATVVSKLFNIVEPSHAFFGEKDAQQLRVIQKMVTDFNFPIEIISCPIIREKNGLAMSSRNQYLTNEEREQASAIFLGLESGRDLLIAGEKNAQTVRDKIVEKISFESSLIIDYVSVADIYTLEEITSEIEKDILVSVAVYLGKVRLIDNFSYSISS